MAPAGIVPTQADRAVIELAIDHFAEGTEVDCVAADDAALRYALAAGVSRVGVLSDLQTVRATWVMVGPGSLADYGDWLPAALAERLAAALVIDIQEILAIEENALTVLRDLGSGDRDELAVTGPAVLVFAPQLAPTRYISRFRQCAVRAVLAPADAAEVPNPLRRLSGDWETVRPRVRPAASDPGGAATAEDRTNRAFGLGAEDAGSRDSHQPLQADPATCAAHLLRYLRHHGLLPRAVVSAPSGAPTATGNVSGDWLPPPSAVPVPEASLPLSARRPRLQGEVLAGRQGRQPRRRDAPLQMASFPDEMARRPRRPGEPGPERRRGPRPCEH
jgi:hypothetical protein